MSQSNEQAKFLIKELRTALTIFSERDDELRELLAALYVDIEFILGFKCRNCKAQ